MSNSVGRTWFGTPLLSVQPGESTINEAKYEANVGVARAPCYSGSALPFNRPDGSPQISSGGSVSGRDLHHPEEEERQHQENQGGEVSLGRQ